MRGTSKDHLTALASLHRVSDPDQREAVWRQSVATLAGVVVNERRYVLFEGINPDSLLRSIQVAVNSGYIEALDWLSPPAAAAALYEIASALPPGDIKRQMGRLLVQRLHDADAQTFVSLATQLALGSQRALKGDAIHARISLVLQLPIASGIRADALALALISRKESSRKWLRKPATGSLPSRRLAARLLEHAAREAARLAAEGDDSGVGVFCTTGTREAWNRLLNDRESLVWRHVASARGLLAASMPAFDEEIQRHLSPDFTITEWRRAATSTAAGIAIDPNAGISRCRQLLESVVFEQDRGVVGAMMHGLASAANGQPYAVNDLLGQLLDMGGVDTVEAYIELRRELGPEFAENTLPHAREIVRDALARTDEHDQGRASLMQALASDLTSTDRPSLRKMLDQAIERFAEEGKSTVAESVERILNATEAKVALLERMGSRIEDRREAFLALRELDGAIFENDVLTNLLILQRADEKKLGERRLGDIFQRITNWLIIQEGDPIKDEGRVPDFTTRLRQLRTLLHLVDADGPTVDGRLPLVRQRRMLTTQVLLRRAKEDVHTPLQRTLFAAAARACDAMVREDLVEISDVLISSAMHVPHHAGLRTMSEASMVPEIENVLGAYARLFKSMASLSQGQRMRNALDSLATLASALPVATSPRVTALRSALHRLHRALHQLSKCHSLSEVDELSNGTPLAQLEESTHVLTQLVRGARRRMGEVGDAESLSAGMGIRLVGIEVERALRAAVSEIDTVVAAAIQAIRRELPTPFADLVELALKHLISIPLDAPRRAEPSASVNPVITERLPAWVPSNRSIGGFYLLNSIGTGAVGSVFEARRFEDRMNDDGETFALKVPDYSGAAARTLSEQEFMHMFREEAGALLSLPEHPNIARFVTFDAGAKPKPILVMEHVEGPSLERILEMDQVSTPGAIDLLLAIGAGLDAMHRVGVGHLDIKPSNIIVRVPDSLTSPGGHHSQPVLVDFGLAGRKLRPGCGTTHYGAPEIWGSGDGALPIPADVYAFGCLAYETLTGRTLFDADSEIALVTKHLSHDGNPEPVEALFNDAHTHALAEFLQRCLRQNPADRVTIAQARQLLAKVKTELSSQAWPVAVP